MESCWWTLKRANEKDLLINDKRVITWCPRCETALAMAEIDYENKDDPSIYVKFPLKNQESNEYTTVTFWCGQQHHGHFQPIWPFVYTLISNTLMLKWENDVYIMAEALVESVLNQDTDDHARWYMNVIANDDEIKIMKILKVVKGSDLEGIEYNHPLLDEIPVQREFKHIILPGEHVTLTEGTGCVHTAPGHGPDDFEIGKKYGLTHILSSG